jgi:hypothetical protein
MIMEFLPQVSGLLTATAALVGATAGLIAVLKSKRRESGHADPPAPPPDSASALRG